MSSRSLNKVQLIGNLTRDPELRYTPQGTPVCSFGIATNRGWVDASGQKQEATEFHRIVAWHKLAELCSQLLFKGRKVFVEGRLQTRSWTGSDEQERTTTEIVIDSMIVLDSKRKDETDSSFTANASSPKPDGSNQVKVTSSAVPAPADDKTVDKGDSEIKDKTTAVKKTAKKTTELSADASEKKEEEEKTKLIDEEVKADDIPF